MTTTVLLLSAGKLTYLVRAFRNAAPAVRVVVADNDPHAPALAVADRGLVAPRFDHEDYAGFLERTVVDHGVDLLLSLHDLETVVVAAMRDRLERLGATFVGPDRGVALACSDKHLTARLLAEHGVAVPTSRLGLDAALAALDAGDLAFPVLLKPRWGMGSKGVAVARDRDELAFFCRRLERESEPAALLPGEEPSGGPRVLVQELVAGSEYGVDVVNDLDGRFRAAVVKRKESMRCGDTDHVVLAEAPAIAAAAATVGAALRHRGNVDCDIMERDGCAVVLDVNPRFGGGYPFSLAAGVDVPAAIVHWSRGTEPAAGWADYPAGRRFRKVYDTVEIR